ncbi:MAG: TonB-dependent receptor [Bacteroides sp.]|nr:TonB-dependent receptor [Bacteroides sp.]
MSRFNIRKTALLIGVCSALDFGCALQTFAASVDASTEVQQAKKIKGTVTDAMGPIIGANVLEKGTTNGVITDIEGNFELNVQPGAVIVVSFIGYQMQEFTVGDQTDFTIRLVEDAEMLDEVVVVGYGVQKKKLVTGATVQVKGDDIAKLNTTSALTAMQSSTPGVQITQSSAQPGQGYKVYIRGMGTTGSASPLYVIDGVSGGSLDNINPADIESIDVLKDAASAAIYGARAANGVILVTTKQGKEGKLQASYDGYVGWSNVYKRPNTLNAQQYMDIIDEYYTNVYGTTTPWSSMVPADILEKVDNGWEGTDWWDLYSNKNALQQNHAFNLTGGTERSKFSMGISYTGNEGVMGSPVEPNYDRYTARINSDHVLLRGKDRDIIKIGENISFYYNKSSHTLAEGNIYDNSIHETLSACPLVPAYADDGSIYNYANYGTGWSVNLFLNPLEGLIHGSYGSLNETRNFGISATAYLEVEPIKNLKWRSQYNVSYSSSSSRTYTEPRSPSNTTIADYYSVSQDASQGSTYSFENTLSYILPELLKGHKLDVMIGQSIQATSWGNDISASNTVTEDGKLAILSDFSTAWLTNVGSNFSSSSTMAGTPWDDSSLASFFGRLNWNYKETYMATATVRMDGSSNFARGHRWGTFPSFSAGWVISNEAFMEKTQSWLDFLKIRVSWGQNGNCDIDNFQYLSTITFSDTTLSNTYKFSSDNSNSVSPLPTAGAYSNILPNEEVTWETSEQLNIGLDARFLNSRLGVTFDYYIKKTKDWLVEAPILDIYGVGAAYTNGGDVENKGFELALTWNDKIGKDFNYRIAANLAYNKNEVTRLANSQGIIYGTTNVLSQSTSYISLCQTGHPIGYFYGMATEGVWQTQSQIDDARAAGKPVLDDAQPGDLIWVDYDGDGTIDYDADRHQIGNPNPDFTFGLSLGFDYKGFDFNVTTHGALGQQIMKSYRSFVDYPFQNYTTEVYERWHGEGTSNTQPRLSAGSHTNNQWISDRYMENGDFWKIQNVTVGYDFKRLWRNLPFSQARIYFQAQNLYTFTGYSGSDPEIGQGLSDWASGVDLGLYPSSRTYIVGVSLKF